MKFRLDNADGGYFINNRLHDQIIKLKSEGFKISESDKCAFIYLDSLDDIIKVHNVINNPLIFDEDDGDLLLTIYDGYIE